MAVARALARWAAGFEPVPDDLTLAGLALADTVAVALAARDHPLRTIAAPLPDAARWAAMAHVLDFDDLHIDTTTHVSVVTVPAVLAVGGDAHAYLAGAGVMVRIGTMLGWSHYAAGWHATCTAGAPAAAVAAGVALGLDAERLATAMALAVPAAGGVQHAFGTQGKSLQVGFAADAGVRAARLAKAGATADPRALDAWLERVGGVPDTDFPAAPAVPGGLAVKLFPCCYAMQRPIAASREVRDRIRGEIAAVTVTTPAGTVHPLIHDRPATGLEGKFSLPYAVAATLLDCYPACGRAAPRGAAAHRPCPCRSAPGGASHTPRRQRHAPYRTGGRQCRAHRVGPAARCSGAAPVRRGPASQGRRVRPGSSRTAVRSDLGRGRRADAHHLPRRPPRVRYLTRRHPCAARKSAAARLSLRSRGRASAGGQYRRRCEAPIAHQRSPLLKAWLLCCENVPLMNISMILEMAASADGDRPVVTAAGRSLTAAELLERARSAAARFRGRSAVLYRGVNQLAYPVALFGAAMAGVPFVPLNYRLGEAQQAEIENRHAGALLLSREDLDVLVEPSENNVPDSDPDQEWDPDAVAVVLYTSGTSAAPKAALLRHRHLLAYILGTQEFGAADTGDAALVAVPPYHVAGLTNLLSNLYSGRRVVYLPGFDAGEWLATVRGERITHAMLVPTMLARVVAAVEGPDAGTPTLRHLAYGGARTARTVVERALELFPETGFVNAYGLTETASSIAVLGPEDHRAALAATEPSARERLSSVGRALPGVEIEIRDDDGKVLAPGETGLVHVRGEQISGEYQGRTALDAGGWFPTRDRGRLDADGYLFIEGRADDTIIRGGENIAPEEIEDVLLAHPDVREAAVVGVPDEEWGQRIVAFVVGEGEPDAVRSWVRERLRTSKTPDAIVFRAELPRTDTGKLLRRKLLAEWSGQAATEMARHAAAAEATGEPARTTHVTKHSDTEAAHA